MTAQIQIPGCSVRNAEPSPELNLPPCPTCHASERQTAEINLATHAEHHGIDPDDPQTRRAAEQLLRNSPNAPPWTQNAPSHGDAASVILIGPLSCRHEGALLHQGTIRGGDGQVFINSVPLSPRRSQQLRNHSPGGFSWGYEGPGPSQHSPSPCSSKPEPPTKRRCETTRNSREPMSPPSHRDSPSTCQPTP